MTTKHLRSTKQSNSKKFYTAFDELDGSHPWMSAVPEGYVPYRVRELNDGQVVYFNYALAKEMGLIDPSHLHCMNADLERTLLKTFSVQIINEYDELTKRRIPEETIKPNKYMATRYLQLQHSNKQGKTSGDGRGIWNGVVSHNGVFWDVSSRGTGVTCLSPGSVEANRPLRTGGHEFGYGCGQAEIDELIGAALLAEAIYLQGIATERVLCVIDLGKGVGIGVRAAPNLIRPAHLFLYLKQENFDPLKRATDYMIDRQILNKRWKVSRRDNSKYDEMLKYVCDSFAEFAAQLESEYVFAWLDWDGDNVLADAGIIDYGSVRQFGIRHDQYRYDDVERFSTNLNEQVGKARQIVQVFAQMADYLKTGRKQALQKFSRHPVLRRFDRKHRQHRVDRLLFRMGFTQKQRAKLVQEHGLKVRQFIKVHDILERAKVRSPIEKVGDGINRPALFNVRKMLRVLPEYLLEHADRFEQFRLPEDDFLAQGLSVFARRKDEKRLHRFVPVARQFQTLYKSLVSAVGGKTKRKDVLNGLRERASRLNAPERMTGNALIEIVDEVLTHRKRGVPVESIQGIIDRVIFGYVGLPEVKVAKNYPKYPALGPVRTDIMAKIAKILVDTSETI